MLYNKYLKMHLKSSLEYKANTIFLSMAQALIFIGEILGVWLLFLKFEAVGEWGFYDSLLMSGVVMTSFSLMECFARGYDEFPNLIKNGTLDRLLVRPVNIHYQLLGAKIEFSKFLRIILGITVSIIAIINMNINWNILKIIVLISMYLSGCIIIFGLMILCAGISIYTIENLEFTNIITNGSKELAYYPINIYKKWLTRIFTFIIPIACFNYLPLSFLLETGSIPLWLCGISPFLGMLFIIPCLIFFNFSLKKYQGTGT